MKCISCKSNLQVVEYQSRAADEAHTTITTCPNCPVSAEKLNSRTMDFAQDRRLPLHARSRAISVSSDVSYFHARHYVSLDVTHEHAVDSSWAHVYEYPVTSVDGHLVLARAYGDAETVYVSNVEASRVGIGAAVVSYRYHEVDGAHAPPFFVSGRCKPVIIDGIGESMVLRMYNDDRINLWVNVEPETALSVIMSLYLRGYTPAALSGHVTADYVPRLRSLSSRAWDVANAPDSGYLYTSKIDGHRKWLVLYQQFMYLCAVGGAMDQCRWWRTAARSSAMIVLDVEYVPGMPLVLIDILTDQDGAFAPGRRDLDWVMAAYLKMESYIPPDIVSIRTYSVTFGDALELATKTQYPTDGVVGIDTSSTEAIKVKIVKSVELRVADDDSLRTEDDIVVCQKPPALAADVGSIVELRFTLRKDGIMDVHDSFVRIDKRRANNDASYRSIIASASADRVSDAERRAALLWCNDLRRVLQQRAKSVSSSSSLIIDVGSGDGQSLDTLLLDCDDAIVFIEPDAGKCKKLRQRIGSAVISTDVHDLTSLMRSLVSRSRERIILNMKLADLADNSEVCDAVMPLVKSVLCTYSAQFDVRCLTYIARTYNVPVIGCTYVYDETVDGVLIDASGVKMWTDRGTANVKWGSDEVYTEPVTTSRDYCAMGAVVSGFDLVPPPAGKHNAPAVSICSRIVAIV